MVMNQIIMPVSSASVFFNEELISPFVLFAMYQPENKRSFHRVQFMDDFGRCVCEQC